MFSLIRTLLSKLALAVLLWLALLVGLPWPVFAPAPAAAQTINFEPPVFLHPDLNGNTVMASNAAGQIIWQERLEPYGRKSVLSNSAAGASSADQGFHGKTRDEETGLIYFGARHYHPLLGRFLSMDPVETQSDNLHSFNRYVFANNNPYKYTDPDGQIPIPIILYYGVTTLTPIVSGLAVRFAASRAVQFGLSVAAGEVGLAVPGATVVGAGAKVVATAEKGGLNLFKWGSSTTTKPGGWKEGDFMLHLPNQGDVKANWAQNAGRLRDQMRQGMPIYDSFIDNVTGLQIPTKGFLHAERSLLESRGWQYSPTTRAYHPPSP